MRGIWYWSIGRPFSLQVGMSPQAIVAVTFSVYFIRSFANTHSGLTWPARHCEMFSFGLLTLELMCLPASCMAASPPLLNGT